MFFSTFVLAEGSEASLGATFSLVLFFSILCFIYLKRRHDAFAPPVYTGWLPWIGCAIEFGKRPLEFIEQKRKELGPVFSLFVAGETMTFVTEPEDFHHFFHPSNVNFQLAFKDAVYNIASLRKDVFFKYHTKVHDAVKGKLATSNLGHLTDNLCQQFNIHINSYYEMSVELELMDTIRRSMYSGVMNNLYGLNRLPVENKNKFATFLEQFGTYDEQFEYGTKLPPVLLRKWSASKTYLLDILRDIVSDICNDPPNPEHETVLEAIVGLVGQDYAPNYSMLILWASLANAIPITFWTLTYILSDKTVLQKLRQELDQVFAGRDKDEMISVTQEDITQVPYLQCCVLEAIRLKSAGIISRRVVKEFKIRDFVVHEGSLLMLSPYWAHRNEKCFPDATKYHPERWQGCQADKGVYLDGFVAFGGGRYKCPGRWFALLEMQMYIALFLLKFDCTVHSEVPSGSTKHLVGTQQPEMPFMVTCCRR